MPKFKFKNASIKGISSVIPPKNISLLDIPNLYNGDEKKLKRIINSSGFLNRRINENDVMTSDLCEHAAKNLIRELKTDISTIDGLIFLSYTPDYIMPATSYVLHKKLGLSENCIVMDIPQACSGYILGLLQAYMLINSGCKRILLLVGDSFSKFDDMFENTAPIFGDAGSASLIEYDENAEPAYFNVESNGNYYDALICRNGGFRNPPHKKDFNKEGMFIYNSSMDGGKIFDFTMEKIAPSIEEILKFSNTQKDKIDYYVMHQANKFILQNIARKLNVDENKIPMETLTKFGNQCGASIPCTISDSVKKEVSEQNLKLLLCGFGVGLSWASAILNVDKIYCSDIIEYKE